MISFFCQVAAALDKKERAGYTLWQGNEREKELSHGTGDRTEIGRNGAARRNGRRPFLPRGREREDGIQMGELRQGGPARERAGILFRGRGARRAHVHG